jgi:DNA invertase Pin-like site-specific DNA recombinase
MKVALYARVSTDDKEQNPETQLFALRTFCQDAGWEIYQEYIDYARAKDYKHREAWQQLQKDARQHKFKVVLVFRLDRAFRSVRECVNLVEDWYDRGIRFKSIAEDVIDTTTAQGRFILQIMAAIAELESSIIGDRVAAGMARAKAEGKHIGRKLLDVSVISICDALWNSSTVRAAAERLHCSRSYIYAELAKFGTTPRDVIEGRWKPPARPLKSQPARLKTSQKSG